jgi:hypothetical protein
MSIADLKQRLAHIPFIENLTMRLEGGKEVYSLGAGFAAVDPMAGDAEIEAAIRTVLPAPTSKATPLPIVNLTEVKPAMPTTPAPGSFAASIKAMMDDARAGVAQARSDGLAKVGEAVGKLQDAKVATAHVAAKMVQTIEDEAASVMSELGQITNEL